MSKIIKWFETPPSPKEARRLFWRIVALDMLCSFTYMLSIFFSEDIAKIIAEINQFLREQATNPPPATEDLDLAFDVRSMAIGVIAWVLGGGIAAPIIEEVIFRLFPIGIAILLFRWLSWTKPLIILAAVSIGIVFGLVHLTESRTIASVLVFQGIGGVLYGIMFAKMSNLNLKGLWRAYKTTVKLHMFWNIVAVPVVGIAAMLIFGGYILAHIEIPPELWK